jgi:tetratricopeptide (TPR) repeat protein
MPERRSPRPRKATGGGRARNAGKPGGKGAGKAGARGAGKQGKRTSKNSDERNPTRSSVDYPSRKFRPKEEPAPEPRPPSSLRKVKRTKDEAPKRATRAPRRSSAPPTRRRRNVKTTEASLELARLAGRNAKRAQADLAHAAETFRAGRERDALRILRPLRDAYPEASAVRELMGLCHYRMAQYAAAAKELEAFVELTNSVEQHPVLMDCMRAQGKYRKVEELWDDLATASPSSALVTEGRIVYAGSLADRGRLRDAIRVLDRRGGEPKRVQEHNLRLWYALADLYDRAGDVPHARDLFLRIRRHDGGFADVAERLAMLA